MLEFIGERAAVEVAHFLNDIRRGTAILITERGRRHLLEIRFGNPVELGLQLRGADWRGSKWIELNGEVAETLNRTKQRGGASSFAEQRGIVYTALSTRTDELFRDAKKLTPRFIDGGRIATIGIVYFRDIAVVEDAGNGKAGHNLEI
jgi:hypothetical protein